jgi:hypothetical protein
MKSISPFVEKLWLVVVTLNSDIQIPAFVISPAYSKMFLETPQYARQ